MLSFPEREISLDPWGVEGHRKALNPFYPTPRGTGPQEGKLPSQRAGTVVQGQVSWLPDHTNPGPSHAGHRWPAVTLTAERSIAHAQWFPGFVPGHSGGGRTGFSPVSVPLRRVTLARRLSKRLQEKWRKTPWGLRHRYITALSEASCRLGLRRVV